MHRNYLQQNLHLNGYNPIVAGAEECSSGHRFGPHARTYWLLHYVFSGKGSFETDRAQYILGAGSCFVIRPDEVTVYRADESDPWEYAWIGFTADKVPQCLQALDVLEVPFLEELFAELRDNVDRYGKKQEIGVCEAYLCGKITEIMTRLELYYALPSESKTESEMYKVKNHIDTRLASALSVTGLAAEFHLSANYLSRRFKEVNGMSPQNYIVHARMQEAARLMRDHGFPPTDAAGAVGYTDICLFSKMFKRKYGVSPRAYKNQTVKSP